MLKELEQILNKLEENTNVILEENKRLENEIKILKGENVDIEKPTPEYNYDGGLLGDLREATYEDGNGIEHSFREDKLILEGNNRYANLAIIYKEKEEDCIPNVQGKYILHIEGYKEKGCANAYVNSTNNLISEDKFNMDIKINASWQRKLRATIFINNTNDQDSKMVITSLKLTKAE